MSATFTCRSNSHPFQERRVNLAEPSKIGRSVARARPAANNAIFDCKVLSRNHALLWFEDGKFFLKDTKSSNGTFVNNRRLSEGSHESLPFEVNSGDIVQFGVDVVENSRRVTHGCIISEIRLYLPNGEEAKQSDASITSKVDKVSHNQPYPTIQSQDLYQLHNFLKEALHREQMLEQKLVLLQRLVADSHECSEKGWQALIDEDKLLSRLEFLENQLQTYSKTLTEESVQKELLQLQEDKHNYETTSKKTLQLVLGEKLEVQQKLGSLERSYSNAEDECTHLRDTLAKAQKDLIELAGRNQRLTTESQDAEKARLEEKRKFESELEIQQQKIERLEESEKDLQERLKTSLADVERYQEEVKDLQSEIEASKSQSKSNNNGEDIPNSEIINGPASLKEKFNDILTSEDSINLNDIEVSFKEDNIEVVKTIEICEKPVVEKMNVVDIPHGQQSTLQISPDEQNLEKTDDQMQDKILIAKLEGRIAQLESLVSKAESSLTAEEERRKDVESRLEDIENERIAEKEMLTETTRELQAALSERENLLEQEENLKSRIEESERLLKACDSDSVSSSSEAEDLTQKGDEVDGLSFGSLTIAKSKLKELKKKLKEKESELEEARSKLEDITSSISQKDDQLKNIKSLLGQGEERIINLEAEILSLRTVSEQSEKLRSELENVRQLAKEKCEMYEEAQLKIQESSESEKELQEMKEQLEREKSEKDKRIKEVEDLLQSANNKQENYEALVKEKSNLESSMKDCIEQIDALKQFQKDSVELAKKNEKLEEEKSRLESDMQSLRNQLKEQEPLDLKQSSSSDLTEKLNDLKKRLKEKQEECERIENEKKQLQGNGFNGPILVAVIAILFGIGYYFLRNG